MSFLSLSEGALISQRLISLKRSQQRWRFLRYFILRDPFGEILKGIIHTYSESPRHCLFCVARLIQSFRALTLSHSGAPTLTISDLLRFSFFHQEVFDSLSPAQVSTHSPTDGGESPISSIQLTLRLDSTLAIESSRSHTITR